MASWIKSSASCCDRPLRRRNLNRPSKCAGRDATDLYRAFQRNSGSSGTGIGHPMSYPRLLEEIFSLDHDVATGVHADSDSAALDVQNGDGDAVADHQSLGQPASQNEHYPLPPDIRYIHHARIDII